MNRKSTLAVKAQRNVLIVIIAIFLLGITTYILFSKILSESQKSQILFFAGDAVSGEQLSDVSVKFIQGRDNPNGESLCQVVVGANEETAVELPYGEYTVQWSADGYYTTYQNVEVLEEETLVREWMVPILEENTVYILAEWESETDLDLCVYNGQVGRCIGRESTLEDAGSFSYGDNDGAKGYELVFLNNYVGNEYGIYVKGNKAPAENQTPSGEVGRTTVSIYTSNGLLYQKESDGIQGTALWYCADISYGQIKEWNEYIFDLTEYAWAARDKGDPEGWIENANIKAEEKYEYHGGVLYDIKVDKYDVNGEQIAYYEYGNNGEVIRGYEDEYDESGQLLTEYAYSYRYRYRWDGLSISKYEYMYEDNRKIVLAYDSEGEIIERKVYVYEDDGKRIVLNYDSHGELIDKREYKYDGEGNLISEVFCDGDGELIYRRESEYDKNGNPISVLSYNGDGELTYREESEYDRNGNLISMFYDSDGLNSRWESEYDQDGNQLSFFIYDRDGIYLGWKKEYDDNNKEIALYRYDKNGLLEDKVEFQYDQNGNRMATCTYNVDGQMTYKSEYDTHGNLTATYEYQDGIITTRKVREYNEDEKCVLIYVYNGDDLESKTTYDYVYEYDTVVHISVKRRGHFAKCGVMNSD